MIFETDEDAVKYVEINSKQTPVFITQARKYSEELCALIEGEKFKELLIKRIEYIESIKKAEVRSKYSRDLRDLIARLLKPIDNVFSAIGGNKSYTSGEYKLADSLNKILVKSLSNIKDNKSVESFLETEWMQLYHSDPAGILWIGYTVNVDKEVNIYPTYQSIRTIRTYEAKGQLVDNILFEPDNLQDNVKSWILVDDVKQYNVLQIGNEFTLNTNPLKTFEHLFGNCPIIINSNLTDKYGNRLSPLHGIIPIAIEYARDLSMKSILKAIHGSPIQYRRIVICAECHGTKKNGTEICKSCSPLRSDSRIDVSDVINIPFDPESPNQLKGEDIAGTIMPPLETLDGFTKELLLLEDNMFGSLWGVSNNTQAQKTATEVYLDMQPQINKLTSYSNVCSWIESTIVEWCANIIDLTKPKQEQISNIVYGKRYLLNGLDTIQDKYANAIKSGMPIGVLDSIYEELLLVKYKNDYVSMQIEIVKSKVEPYLHSSADMIFARYGQIEALRKDYFQQWWSDLDKEYLNSINMDVKKLEEKQKADFDVYLPTVKLILPPAPISGK